MQTLVQQTFSLGPYKQTRALGKAAQFTWKFGAFVFVLGEPKHSAAGLT